jgi:hypothetical protein
MENVVRITISGRSTSGIKSRFINQISPDASKYFVEYKKN